MDNLDFDLINHWLRVSIDAVNWPAASKIGIQLLILGAIFYFIYSQFIRRSHAEQLLRGLFVTLMIFITFWAGARAMGFPMLEVVFGASIQMLIIGLIVIFQPELRRLLLYLGQGDWFSRHGGGVMPPEERKAEFLINELVEAVRFFCKTKTGALVVLESSNAHEGSYLEAGTALDARLSTELLLTIFHPSGPLHDGAVIISSENRIAAAGVLLPLTEDPNLSWRFGTRHRAAIGLTESTDGRCIVVSEETGTVSLVEHGKLEKLQGYEDLRRRLENIYHISHEQVEKVRKSNRAKQIRGLFTSDTFPSNLQKIFNWGHKSGSETSDPKASSSSSRHP